MPTPTWSPARPVVRRQLRRAGPGQPDRNGNEDAARCADPKDERAPRACSWQARSSQAARLAARCRRHSRCCPCPCPCPCPRRWTRREVARSTGTGRGTGFHLTGFVGSGASPGRVVPERRGHEQTPDGGGERAAGDADPVHRGHRDLRVRIADPDHRGGVRRDASEPRVAEVVGRPGLAAGDARIGARARSGLHVHLQDAATS